MKLKLSLSLIIFSIFSNIYSQDYNQTIVEFQEKLNNEFRDPKESPLNNKDRKKFKKLHFFPIDERYKVTAKFIKIESPKTLKMNTSGGEKQTYDVYAIAKFELNGMEFQLNVYQSHLLRKNEKYKTYLFLPFKDLTNGSKTYGGGRYIDLQIPLGDTIEIDFNKAYHPYCAYNYVYSCPIPPIENHLNIKIKAGVKL